MIINNDVLPLSTLESISDALRGEWFEPFYLVAAFAGLRRAECVGLKIEDLEFRNDGFCAIYISRGVQRVNGETIIVPSKMCGHSQQVEYKHYIKATAGYFIEILKK